MPGRPVRRARLEALNSRWGPVEEKPDPPSPAAPTRAEAVSREIPDGFAEILGGLRPDQMDRETSEEFTGLRKLAFQFARDIMELPLNPTDKNFGKLLSVKQAIATAVFTATTRVRPGDLRDRDDDGVGALLAIVKRGILQEGPELDPAPLTADEMLN